MVVSREDLERSIEELRREVTDPDVGIYGPGSISWNVGREAALFLGGGRAALLQVAHPFVAHAVDQHSATRTDPLGRFQRTFYNVFKMVFGDLDDAIRSARRVHAVHERIVGYIAEDVGRFRDGARYAANDESALFWVHATLIDSAVMAHDLFVRPLSFDEKDRYYRESRRFARLFGIPDAVMPEGWADFADYFQTMVESDTIAVGQPARDLARFLFSAPRRTHRPIFQWARLLTAGLLPGKVREGLGLPFGRKERALFEASVAVVSRAYPRLPARLRYAPAYVKAIRRLEGRREPDRFGELIERLTLEVLDAKG